MKNENIILDEDLDFINDIESGKLGSVGIKSLSKFKKEGKIIAENTILRKTRKKALNIRLIEDDIIKIKAIALRKGLPYQTYIASEIHKMVSYTEPY